MGIHNKKRKGDEDYELRVHNRVELEEGMIEHNQCAFCCRQDPPLVGPFVNSKKPQESPIFFHNDCLEINDFTFYDYTKSKWVNIAKALDQILRKSPSMCIRCNKIGATTKCQSSCSKMYHGYICSSLAMVRIENGFECLVCKNKDNHDYYKGRHIFTDKEKENIKINISRDTVL